MAVALLLDEEPAEQAGGSGDEGVEERGRGETVGAEGRAAVEAEPAEPEQPGTEHHHRQVVRAHGVLLEADARAHHQGECQTRRSARDLHHEAPGEVQGAQGVRDPAAGSPHPVCDGNVYEQGPHRHEDQPGRELHAVRDGAADQCRRDDREGELERGEQQGGDAAGEGAGTDARQADVVEVADEIAAKTSSPKASE